MESVCQSKKMNIERGEMLNIDWVNVMLGDYEKPKKGEKELSHEMEECWKNKDIFTFKNETNLTYQYINY